jgi:hypothetical protein
MEHAEANMDLAVNQSTQRRFSRDFRHDPDHLATLKERAATFKGLCSNCEHLLDCGLVKPTADTQFCEEYSYEQPESQLHILDLEPAVDLQARELGLCVNCESRATCTFPRPQGGVWFCAEYA